eukprot:3883901-Rhodomonas_salina.3
MSGTDVHFTGTRLLFLLGLGGLLVTISARSAVCLRAPYTDVAYAATSAPRKGISGRDGLDYIPASVVVWYRPPSYLLPLRWAVSGTDTGYHPLTWAPSLAAGLHWLDPMALQ